MMYLIMSLSLKVQVFSFYKRLGEIGKMAMQEEKNKQQQRKTHVFRTTYSLFPLYKQLCSLCTQFIYIYVQDPFIYSIVNKFL